ncbi:hypothetical protein ISCGN_023384 [Ixodes scapularis]
MHPEKILRRERAEDDASGKDPPTREGRGSSPDESGEDPLPSPVSVGSKVWDRQRDEDLTALAGEPVDLSGDGRCDSPGHSAKYMTYSFYSHRLGKIVHTELVQVKECPEVSASSNMEKEGCARGISFLKSRNVLIRSFTTDRHSSIKAYMRIHQPAILHLFDVWHAVKGIRKKLAAGSKCAGCKDLAPWVSPVCNHLWWCATASGGNEYVDRLHEEVLERCKTYPTFKEALAEKSPKVPPAFVSPVPRPSKEELVSAHRRRFAKPSLEGDG